MEASTWTAWCKAILSKLAERTASAEVPVYPELEFKCNVCGMVWKCLTNLEGKRHLALQVRCGGTWVKKQTNPTEPVPGQQSSQAEIGR